MQVVNADAMVVKLNSGEYKTIHLSSIRPPRIEGEVKLIHMCICLSAHFAHSVLVCVHVCVAYVNVVMRLASSYSCNGKATDITNFTIWQHVRHKNIFLQLCSISPSLYISLVFLWMAMSMDLTTWWRPCSRGTWKHNEKLAHTQLQYCREWSRSILLFLPPFPSTLPVFFGKSVNTHIQRHIYWRIQLCLDTSLSAAPDVPLHLSPTFTSLLFLL